MLKRFAILAPVFLLLAGCQGDVQQMATNTTTESASARGKIDSAAGGSITDNHPLHEYGERNDDPIAAAADRFQRRLGEDGRIPERALLTAKTQRDRMLAQARRTAARGKKPGSQRNLPGGTRWPVTWDWKGPGNIGGRLRPIVIHPVMPNIMYVGSASGGIWKTIDGGSNWLPLDDFLPSLSVSDMVMHPADSDVLYAATGEGFFEAAEGSSNTAAVRGAGIFKSIDAGATWTQISSTDNSDFYFVNRLAFDPADPGTMLCAAGSGIWRSTDDGLTWNLQLAVDALDVKFDPNDPLNVVAGCHHEHDGPWYSSDGGINWTQATGAGGHRQEICWAPSDPDCVFAAVSNDSGRIQVWKSVDAGQNFSQVTTGSGIQTWASYNNTIWVDPFDSNFMILGGVYLYNSVDGGTTFDRRFNAVHADMHRIVPHPGFNGTTNTTVYFATDGGIYQTNNVYGSSAFDLNNNLGVTQFYGGGINPDTGHIIGGTQDNGTLFYSGDPQNWDHIFGGDGGYGAADPLDPDYFYGEVQRALLHRSTNGGAGNNSYIYAGPNPIADAGSSATTNFIPFFMLDPNEPNRMLVCCERLWRSNNVKASQPDWFPIKDAVPPPPGILPPGPAGAHFNPNKPENISTVEVADGNPDVIWVGHNNGHLFYTTNGTAASPGWIRVDENGTGLPNRWISTIRIDPRDHNHVYVALMGWASDNLWETTDGGNSWVDVSGGGANSIPDAPISALALHPQLAGWLFVGTDVGVFSSSDNGLSWSTSPEGPAAVPVEQLLWKDDHSLLAVTHGRGMYVATEATTVAAGAKRLDGIVDSGTLSDAQSSNDIYYRISPSPTKNPMKQIVDIIFVGTSVPATPEIFQFRVQAKMLGGPEGDVIQQIDLLNNAGQFETVDIRPASTSDETVLVMPDGDLTRFVHPLTQEVIAKVRWNSPSFAGATFDWTVDIDEAVWLIQD